MLVPRPGDESIHCGGLIAQSCRRGWPPFVMVLGDGTSTDPAAPADALAHAHARETAAALDVLGLDRGRLLFAGIRDAHLADGGALFDAAVRAVVAVMWRQDCNVVLAPATDGADPAGRATGRIADAVAGTSLVRRLAYGQPASRPALHLDLDREAKGRAIACHASRPGPATTLDERYAHLGDVTR